MQISTFLMLEIIKIANVCISTQAAIFHQARNTHGGGGVCVCGGGGGISECLGLGLQGQHLPSGHQALISLTGRWRGAARHL